MALPSHLIVELSDEEIAEVRQAAVELSKRSEHITNPTRFHVSRSQEATDLLALTGEYAVAKLFGLGLDACRLRLKGVGMNGGVSLVLPDGITALVRTVSVHTNPNRAFWFSPNMPKFVADIGIIAYVLERFPGQVKIPGYVTRERFAAEHHVVNLGSGLCAAMSSCRFNPIEPLLSTRP